MKRVALYVRVSTEEQKLNGLSIETQISSLTEYAEKHHMIIVDTYIDAGLTARKKLAHRKELKRLLDDVQKGLIDVIIFTKLDRWFRNIADYYKVQEILDNNNVNWKTIYESYDTSTSNGRLHINIMLSIAQDEADRTSERIKVVFENKRAKGETPANRAPIGYKIENSKLLVDPETKQMAIDIFNHYDLYHSVQSCVRLCLNKYDKKVYGYTIRRMLENKTYIGEFRNIKNFCEAIITEDQFHRVNTFRDTREFKNRIVDGRVYLFTSLLKCKECGHNLTCCFNIQKHKDGPHEYHYYRCKEATTNYACTHKRQLNEDKIEKYLLDNLVPLIQQQMYDIETKKKTSPIRRDIPKLKNRLEKLKDLYLDDLISKEDYRIEYESITKRISEANMLESSNDTSQYKEILGCDFLSLYNSFTPLKKKAFWLGIIDHIDVDNDFNYDVFFRI